MTTKNIDELTLDEIKEQMALYQRLYYKGRWKLTHHLWNGKGHWEDKSMKEKKKNWWLKVS